MILRVNAVCAIIVFCFRSFCQRILWDFVPSVVLACQELGNGYVHFNLNEDLKIGQNLMTLTRMQAESQRKVKVKSLSRVQLLVTPWTAALPGFSIHGIFQARVLEWIAISFSRGSSRPRNQTRVSRIAGRRFTI